MQVNKFKNSWRNKNPHKNTISRQRQRFPQPYSYETMTEPLGQVGELVGRHDMATENNLWYLNELLLEGDSNISEIFRAVQTYIEKASNFK